MGNWHSQLLHVRSSFRRQHDWTRRSHRRTLLCRWLCGHRSRIRWWSWSWRRQVLWKQALGLQRRHLAIKAIPIEGAIQCWPESQCCKFSTRILSEIRPTALCYLDTRTFSTLLIVLPSWQLHHDNTFFTNENTWKINYTLLIYYSTQLQRPQQKEDTSKPINQSMNALPSNLLKLDSLLTTKATPNHSCNRIILHCNSRPPSRLLIVNQDLAKTQTGLENSSSMTICFICILQTCLFLFLRRSLRFLRHDNNTKCTKQPKIKTAILI